MDRIYVIEKSEDNQVLLEYLKNYVSLFPGKEKYKDEKGNEKERIIFDMNDLQKKVFFYLKS